MELTGKQAAIKTTPYGFAYFAENDYGMAKSLDIAKRCAIVNSYAPDEPFTHISEEMETWMWSIQP